MANYLELLKDPRWQKKRLEILQRDDWFCQACRDSESTLHVHHLKYTSAFPWETPDHLLITLCESCHANEEAMKGYDYYELLVDTGLTRKDLVILLEHVKFRMIKSTENKSPFWVFTDDVLARLVTRDELNDLVDFLMVKRKEVNHG